ncbi:hypothetical protein MBANPS3_008150 [Mucor bainieri]
MHSLKLYANAEFSPVPEYQVMDADYNRHDGVIFSLKLTDEDMFLPEDEDEDEDEDEMLEFLSGDTIDQHGRGGNGKTVAINTLISNLKGVVASLSKDYVGSSSSLSTTDMYNLLSSRFATYGDVALSNGKINQQFWKMLSGGDTIKLPSGEGRLNCTGVFAGNSLWLNP